MKIKKKPDKSKTLKSKNIKKDDFIGTESMDDTNSFGNFLNDKHERKQREGLL